MRAPKATCILGHTLLSLPCTNCYALALCSTCVSRLRCYAIDRAGQTDCWCLYRPVHKNLYRMRAIQGFAAMSSGSDTRSNCSRTFPTAFTGTLAALPCQASVMFGPFHVFAKHYLTTSHQNPPTSHRRQAQPG